MKDIIYQTLPRLWGAKGNQSGKFSAYDDLTLDYLSGLGVTHVWYTGVIRHATTYSCPGCPASGSSIVKGKAGSPYSIVDYYDVNPFLADNPRGRMEEFETLVERTHAHGLKVIMDFIPNHVSRDYGKVGLVNEDVRAFGADDDPSAHWKPENDFYYYPGEALRLPVNEPYEEFPAKASGNVFSPAPGINDWYETVKLNYCDFHTGTWDKALDIVRYWCAKGVDGFRCDMVELVPWQFMKWLIENVKKEYPKVIFIAEVYVKERYSLYVKEVGFDYLYDKSGLYDCLYAIVQGHGSARGITYNWQSLGDLRPHTLNFLENHDEPRFASDFFGRDADRSYAPLAASLYSGTSPFMLYFGEELGERGMDSEGFSSVNGRTTIFDWWTVGSLDRLYDCVHGKGSLGEKEERTLRNYREALRFASEPAISEGKDYDLCYCNLDSPGFDPDRHFAFLRSDGEATWLFVCDFADTDARISLRVPREAYEYLEVKNPNPVSEIEVSVKANNFTKIKL